MAVEVSTDDEDGTSLSEETASQLFIVTIGMISLINKAIKAKSDYNFTKGSVLL